MPDASEPTRTFALPTDGATFVAQDATATHVPGADRLPAAASIPGYEIESLLGRGGMGVVYKARHLALKRTVALKLVLAGPHAAPHQLARFRIEAEAAARLPHPNIVQIHEIGDVEGSPYCALEFVEGSNLAQRLGGNPMPPREAAKLVEVLARAMQLAHSRNVVHRDLKPANILITTDGTPKITDFGLARQLDSDSGETQAGAVMGTPSYMAPEQASGRAHEAGPAADVYALGAILYDCLAGRPPFKGDTVVETIDQVRSLEPQPPSNWQAGVPADLDTICLKCLRKEPENRYSSSAELAAELVRFLNGEPILARPAGRIERASKWVRRNPVVTGAVAAVALALAAGTTVSYVKYRDAEDQRKAADEATAVAKREREAERWERYRSNLIAAGSAMQLHNVSAASGSLEAAPEEHRGWEWRHYHHQLDTAMDIRSVGSKIDSPRFPLNGALAAFGIPENGLRVWDLKARKEVAKLTDSLQDGTVCFSPDGKLAAFSRMDNCIELRDVAGGRTLPVLRGAEQRCTVPEFSPDSKLLASGSYDRVVRVWDVETGKLVHTLRGHGDAVHSTRFSPDGRWLASDGGEDRNVRIWNLSTGDTDAILSGGKSLLRAMRYYPRGNRVVAAERYPNTNLLLWDSTDGKQIAVLKGHTIEVQHLEFSTDGSRIVTGSTDHTARVWDSGTGALLATLPHAGWVHGLAFSPDGKRIATASQDQTVRLWTADGAPLAILHGHTADVVGVVFSADGSTITSFSPDGEIRWWDARLAEKYGVLRDHDKFVYGVAFHPDGERVASASWDGTVRIWNATTSESLSELKHPENSIVTSVAFHPAGKRLASLCRQDGIRIWDVDTATELHRLPLPANHWQDSRLAFSPNGDWLACGDKEHTVRVWDTKTWSEAATFVGHKDFVRDVVFATDGTWLASASEGSDPVVRIWDLNEKKQVRVLEGHAGTVYALAVSRDGKWLASGSTDGTVRLWDTTTWAASALPLKHGVNVYGLSFSPDGTRLATACANNMIRLWDLSTRQLVAELHGHGAYVHQVAWSPDGTRLLSGSGDKTLRVWDSLPAHERMKRSAGTPHSK